MENNNNKHTRLTILDLLKQSRPWILRIHRTCAADMQSFQRRTWIVVVVVLCRNNINADLGFRGIDARLVNMNVEKIRELEIGQWSRGWSRLKARWMLVFASRLLLLLPKELRGGGAVIIAHAQRDVFLGSGVGIGS